MERKPFMNIAKLAFLSILLLFLSACSTPLDIIDNVTGGDTSSKGSYQALLFVSGEELQSAGETANDLNLEVGELIGTVKEKVAIEIPPTVELTSNYLEEGTKIYSVEGNTKIVLAKKANGDYEVFE
jgi:hypothetical protein